MKGELMEAPEYQNAEAVDGYTWAEIKTMVLDGVAFARCTECGESAAVEPDAEDYDCQSCLTIGSVTSPLRKLELI